MSAAADALMGIFGFKRVEGEMSMTEVKTADLVGAALHYAYNKATGNKPTATVDLLPAFARFIINEKLGDVVSVPSELLEKAE